MFTLLKFFFLSLSVDKCISRNLFFSFNFLNVGSCLDVERITKPQNVQPKKVIRFDVRGRFEMY